jgi:hypothetical protein
LFFFGTLVIFEVVVIDDKLHPIKTAIANLVFLAKDTIFYSAINAIAIRESVTKLAPGTNYFASCLFVGQTVFDQFWNAIIAHFVSRIQE